MFGANPTDGWKAIVVAVCASIVQAVVLGVNNSFPNFVALMMSDDDLEKPSSSLLSWVQAVSLGLSAVLAVPAGIFVAKFGTRLSSLIASVSLIICMLLTSLAANSGAALFGTYSVFMGIAIGFMMSPGATATATWFEKRAALGMGIAFSGGGTGSLSIPRIAGALANNLSWRTSFLILAALGSISVVASFFICIRPKDSDEDEEEGNQKFATKSSPTEASPTGLSTSDAHAEANDSTNDRQQTVPATVLSPPNEMVAVVPLAPQEPRPFNYHTDKATFKQLIFECLLTRNFIGLFLAYGFFSLGFYSMLYIAVPYPLSMGTGPYSNAASISVDGASNVFVPFGVMETLGPLFGWLANVTDERIVFIGSMGMLAVAGAFYALCRKLWEFLVIFVVFGSGVAGFFATFGTMIAQRFYGPNLSVIMSCGFSGAALGGFFGTPIATEIANSQGGDYTYTTVFISLAFFVSGLCVMFIVTDPPVTPPPPPAPSTEPQSFVEAHTIPGPVVVVP